jgi:CHAT domain-containing protein
VAGKIAGKRILVVADGALQNVPFAALPIPGRRDAPVPMFVVHEIVSLPSASVLAVLRQQGSDREPGAGAIAVLADPVFEADDPRLPAVSRSGGRRSAEPSTSETSADAAETTTRALRDIGFLRDGKPSVPRLAATRREADAIVAAAPAGLAWRAIDFDASRVTAMSGALAKYRIVHFATHGLFNADHPELSGLILSLFDKRGPQVTEPPAAPNAGSRHLTV